MLRFSSFPSGSTGHRSQVLQVFGGRPAAGSERHHHEAVGVSAGERLQPAEAERMEYQLGSGAGEVI